MTFFLYLFFNYDMESLIA